MKPIILKAGQDGKIMITAEEIEKMVSDAYNEGYCDGKANGGITITQPSPWTPSPYIPTWYTTVTCDNLTVSDSNSSLYSDGSTGSGQNP